MCASGAALVDGCDNPGCVDFVCNNVDPYCCNTKWDSTCVSEAENACGFTCSGGC
jgi:hypothetical protein